MGISTKFVVVNMTDRLSCASVPKVADALLAGETIEMVGATLGVSEPPQLAAISAPLAIANKLIVSFSSSTAPWLFDFGLFSGRRLLRGRLNDDFDAAIVGATLGGV